jgi:uncharacterized protein (TIGR02594 family)
MRKIQHIIFLLVAFLLPSCSIDSSKADFDKLYSDALYIYYPPTKEIINPLHTALAYLNFQERRDRAELKSFIGVDPVKTEWCAAFVNAVLHHNNIPGSAEFTEYPLLARSFLEWGEPIKKEELQPGDIVIFPRGKEGWKGHVGFFVETRVINNREYFFILGGNQDDKVSIEAYPSNTALGMRRYTVFKRTLL